MPQNGRFWRPNCQQIVTAVIRHGVSRLVVDPERFPDDRQEPMASRGMGAVYTHTSRGLPLRRNQTPKQRQDLLDAYYWPHHRRLESAVSASLMAHGQALIVDCHSFPSRPSPYERDQDADRTDICIGTDGFHTPPSLQNKAVHLFRQKGFTVSVNRPFAGSLVPLKCYRQDPHVQTVMIELNRRLYMNEDSGDAIDGYGPLFQNLQEVLTQFPCQ
jgi:N-formylglutamate deformylase